ncbi:MAG TPA: FG-GAP-like repeat-containing protein, partial [Gammaproteobacteria bacterium]|nr:FG-GAP-like repeat-containing protein [Gammaproteobacteria bacterium]
FANGPGTFGGLEPFMAGDVDHDGLSDVIVTGAHHSLLVLGRQISDSAASQSSGARPLPGSVISRSDVAHLRAIGDLDGDGYDDLAGALAALGPTLDESGALVQHQVTAVFFGAQTASGIAAAIDVPGLILEPARPVFTVVGGELPGFEEHFVSDVLEGNDDWIAIANSTSVTWQVSDLRDSGATAQAGALYFGNLSTRNFSLGSTAVTGTAISPSIAVPDDATGATLTFSYFLATENHPYWDIARVLVNGAAVDGAANLPDTGGTWRQVSFSLNEVIDDGSNDLVIQFDFDSRDGILNQFEGWYVDDVQVAFTGAVSTQQSLAATPLITPIGDIDGDGFEEFAAAEALGGSVLLYTRQAWLDAASIAVEGADDREAPELFAWELATPATEGVTALARTGLDFLQLDTETDGTATQVRDAFALEGAEADEELFAGRVIGDVNGDGLDDLLVEGESTAYLVFGPVELAGLRRIDVAADVVINTDSVGLAADRLGDIDGDGITDLVFKLVERGSLTVTLLLSDGEFGGVTEDVEFLPRELDAAWIAAVQSRPDQGRVRTLAVPDVFTQQAASVNVLEFDGDGTAEILVMARQLDTVAARLYPGEPGSDDGVIEFTAPSPVIAVVPGDLDGDGRDDVLFVNRDDNTVGLWRGGQMQPSPAFGLLDFGALGSSSAPLGIGSVATLGDVNGDGYADFGIASERQDGAAAGALFIYLGRADLGADSAAPLSPDDADLVFRRAGVASLPPGAAYVGVLQATAGDFNADGETDLVIGEPERTVELGGETLDRNDQGRAYVFLSPFARGTSKLSLTQADAILAGEFEFDAFGSLPSVPAFDLNNDGVDDLLIGAGNANGVVEGLLPEAGRVYVVEGASRLFDLPAVFDILANLTVTGSGDYLVDEGTGRPAEFSSAFAPGTSERWFRFTTLGDGRSGNAIVLSPGYEDVQRIAPTVTDSSADGRILEFDLGAFFDQAADPAALERVLLQLSVLREDVVAAARPVDPEQLVVSGGKLYFVATPDDGSSGKTLWVSDGTADGTMRLAGAADTLADPANLTDVGGTLFFTANPDTLAGTLELFTSDGTLQGTVRVDVDLVSSLAGVQGHALPDNAGQFTTDGERLYFVSDDTALVSSIPGAAPGDRHGLEVWVSDGTTGGTFVL